MLSEPIVGKVVDSDGCVWASFMGEEESADEAESPLAPAVELEDNPALVPSDADEATLEDEGQKLRTVLPLDLLRADAEAVWVRSYRRLVFPH
jgi:hypothetical protein